MPRYYPIRLGAQLREHIRALRKAARLTQVQLGQRLGVGQARIAEIESNPAAMSVEQLLRLLSILGSGLALSETRPAGAIPSLEEARAPRGAVQGVRLGAPRSARAPLRKRSESMIVGAQAKGTGGDPKALRRPKPAYSDRNFVIRPKKGAW